MSTSPSARVIIIGAGFGGLGLGVLLKQAGHEDFLILERADDIGGVWRDNHYPGAACDVPAVLYAWSFEADHPWSCAYPPQREILGYMREVVAKHGLGPHLRFGQRVEAARYDAQRAGWSVRTDAGDEHTCDVLVSAVGLFNDPAIPRLEGIADFQGLAFHSAQWRDGEDWGGRRVAVLGTGASAIQIVPELAGAGALVTVYQRTAPYVMPKSEVDLGRRAAERERIFDEFEAVSERRKNPGATQAAQEAFLRYLETQVPDPQLRKVLTPDFTLGCKRSLFSNDWYPALQRPGVSVVSEPIARLTAKGVRTRDGVERAADALLYATGFHATNYLPGMRVQGRDGLLLSEAWREGARAHLGITVAGFPNLFLLFGPNTNTAGSVIFTLECQARYVLQALALRARLGLRSLEVRAEVMRDWVESMQAELRSTTYTPAHCRSYYMDGSGRIVTQFPGGQRSYQAMTQALRAEDFLLA